MTDCLFCKIIEGEIPSKKVYENDYVYAFYDINPKAKVHVLVVPKKHCKNLIDFEDEKLMAEMIKGVKETAKVLGLNDYKILVNNGEKSGQIVFHLHFHILSGF